MKTIEEIWSIVNGLKELYPDGVCSLDYRKDYELLFSVRLAAQCTDERVNKVTPALYARFPTLEALAEAVRRQWLTDNKRFGLDVQQIRYGGLCARLEEAARAVRDYLDGRVEAIDELEQKRLFFDCRPDDDGQDIRIQPNVWSQMVTVNTL